MHNQVAALAWRVAIRAAVPAALVLVYMVAGEVVGAGLAAHYLGGGRITIGVVLLASTPFAVWATIWMFKNARRIEGTLLTGGNPDLAGAPPAP